MLPETWRDAKSLHNHRLKAVTDKTQRRAIAYFCIWEHQGYEQPASHRTWHGLSIFASTYVSLVFFCPSFCPCISAFFVFYCGLCYRICKLNGVQRGSASHGDSEWPWMHRIKHNGYHLHLPPALPLNESETCPLSLLTGFARFSLETALISARRTDWSL